MKVIPVSVTLMHTNAYFYYDDISKEAVLIDPGADAGKLMKTIEENELKLSAILLTHGHFDHIGAVNKIRELTGVKVLVHEDEDELIKSEIYNESKKIARKSITVECDELFKDGCCFTVGSGKLEVIHTPGHTSGGVCFYDSESGIVFTGDTLFKDSIGRYDLVTSNGKDLHNSITKLFSLPDEVKVYPGHGSATTIEREKLYNLIAASLGNNNGL